MPDIFLRPGEANPNDVRLRDPLSFEQQAGAFDILGGASVPAPNVNQQAGAFPLLGLATTVAPVIVAGNVNVAPSMQGGGATYSTADLAYNQAIPYNGGAALLTPAAAFSFRVQPDVLGTATLPAPTISQGTTPDTLGGASLPAPTIQQAITAPGVLGGATNPAPVISVGTPSIVAPPSLSGGTTYSSTDLAYDGGTDYDGGAALLAPSVAVAALAVAPGVLGGAAVLAPTIQQAIAAPGVLGGADIPVPSISQSVAVDTLGGADTPAPSISVVSVPPPGAAVVTGRGGRLRTPPLRVIAVAQGIKPARLGGAFLNDLIVTQSENEDWVIDEALLELV